MATSHRGQSTKGQWAKPLDPIGDVACEAPLRVFRYAPASPFHLTRYETKQTNPLPRTREKDQQTWQNTGNEKETTLPRLTRPPARPWFFTRRRKIILRRLR
jgi:hypothetical protein